jgi:DNA invertase Pin-like site-specific DNA recombinase
MNAAITYYRASTDPIKQANSIAIQRGVCEDFAARNDYTIVNEFSDYASGADNEREGFNAALAYAVENDCKIIAYKVDRISRNLSVFSKIENILNRFLFCELGNQTPSVLLISVLLSVAAQERLNISARQKALIAHKRETMGNDFKWGNPNLADQRLKGLAVRKANAKKHNDRVRSICKDFRAAGYTKTTQLVEKLAEVGVMTRRGAPYTYTNLYRVLAS